MWAHFVMLQLWPSISRMRVCRRQSCWLPLLIVPGNNIEKIIFWGWAFDISSFCKGLWFSEVFVRISMMDLAWRLLKLPLLRLFLALSWSCWYAGRDSTLCSSAQWMGTTFFFHISDLKKRVWWQFPTWRWELFLRCWRGRCKSPQFWSC